MAIVDARGFQLAPDLAGSIRGTAKEFRDISDASQFKSLIGQPDGQGLEQARQQFPQRTQDFESDQAQLAKQKLAGESAQQQQEITNFSQMAARLKSIPDNDKPAFLRREIQAIAERNGTPDDTAQLLATFLENPEEGNLQIDETIKFGQLAGVLKESRVDIASAGKAGIDEVQSSKINEDGSATVVTKGGVLKTISPTELGAQIVANANAAGIDIQQKRAQGREKGKGAAKLGSEAIKQASTLRVNNNTLRQVIDEVRGGAETGPLSAKLPSFRAESVRLDQLRNKLGLDVVGSVTFGALSEGELKLAMSTALPTKLNGPELIQWADDKITAQEKLATYLEEQAIFLDKSGNTAAGWIEAQKVKSQSQPVQRPDQTAQAAPQALPQGVSEDDIAETMRANNMTREQVLQRLSQ